MVFTLLLLALVALSSARPGTTTAPTILPQYTCTTQAMAYIYPAMSASATLITADFTEKPMCRNAAGTFVAKSPNATVTAAAMAAACSLTPATFTRSAWLSCYTANTPKTFLCGKFTCP